MLAGCYRPSELLTCENGSCVLDDATPDVQLDGGSDANPPEDGQPLVTCVDSTFQTTTPTTVQGTSYSRNVSSFAVFTNTSDQLTQISTPGATQFPVSFAVPPAAALTRPVLASSTQNGEVHAFFVQGTALVRSTFNSGNLWEAPIAISTSGVTLDATFVLGQPTVTLPRRALASRNGQAFEGVENGTSWAFTAITIPGVTNVLHPSLSSDGLAVVFVATDRMFLAKRATVTSAFELATPLPDQAGGNEQFPRFGPGCDHIFVSIDQTVVDVH